MPTIRHKENAPGSSRVNKATKSATPKQKETLQSGNGNVGDNPIASDQPQKRSKGGDDKTKPPKKTKVVKQTRE